MRFLRLIYRVRPPELPARDNEIRSKTPVDVLLELRSCVEVEVAVLGSRP